MTEAKKPELPGMWESADFLGGATDCVPGAAKPTFAIGDKVQKIRGSSWRGNVVGRYSTRLTPEGYAVESDTETGSVQIYPASALEKSVESGWCPSCGADLTNKY